MGFITQNNDSDEATQAKLKEEFLASTTGSSIQNELEGLTLQQLQVVTQVFKRLNGQGKEHVLNRS